MKNAIVIVALLFNSISLFAKEGQNQCSKLANLDQQQGITLSHNIENTLSTKKVLILSSFCGCDDQLLYAMTVNDIFYDYERRSCIEVFGNTSDGIHCQTIALRNWSEEDQRAYSDWKECNRRCAVP
jgi:hypothetical protein